MQGRNGAPVRLDSLTKQFHSETDQEKSKESLFSLALPSVITLAFGILIVALLTDYPWPIRLIAAGVCIAISAIVQAVWREN